MDTRAFIAQRIAKEFKTGMVVNLGIGIPTGAANYIPDGVRVILQTENGGLLFGPKPERSFADPDVANAGGEPITMLPGASSFDLSMSFCIIRGGHVDATVLGALEVDAEGNIANWNIPGKYVPGMGGGMDLLTGAKRVIVAMNHVDKNGNPKIRKTCTLPLSARKAVDLIITDKAVLSVETEGLMLLEVAPGSSIEEIRRLTEADLMVSSDLQNILAA